ITLDDGQRHWQQQTAVAPLANLDAIRRIAIRLPATSMAGLKLWLHQLPIEGGSLGVPARVTIAGPGWSAPITLSTTTEHSQQLVPLSAPCDQVEIVLAKNT
ncbi:MAG: hypothetical protein KDE58_06090, partial [Caldilineaceae bacterium]|nr:hypothetical protein [Caldilineaceae bacterium]